MKINKLEIIIVGMVIGFVATTLFTTKAKADTWIVSTVTSYHFDRSKGYNENNFGLGFEQDVDFLKHGRVVGGFYKNSDYNQSLYGGFTYMPWTVGPAKVGAMFGVVTGYDKYNLMPVVVPTVTFEGKTFGANIGFLPSMIGLQLKMKF